MKRLLLALLIVPSLAFGAGPARKLPVRAAATGNVILSGTQTLDGFFARSGMRVMLPNQTDKTKNGIYVVSETAWARSTDADASGEITAGFVVQVQGGATYGGKFLKLTTAGSITIGTTPLDFAPTALFIGDTASLVGASGHVPAPAAGDTTAGKFLKADASWEAPTTVATAVPFSGVTTGTNAAALHVGTGGALDATGSGTIVATSTTGNAATVTTADAAGDTTTFPMLATDATGSLAPATDAGLTYNATTDNLTTTTFTGSATLLNGTTWTAPGAIGGTTGAAMTATHLHLGQNGVSFPMFLDGVSGGGSVVLGQAIPIKWATETDPEGGTFTVGLARGSAGVLKVTDGGAGSGSITAADLAATSETITGTLGANSITNGDGSSLTGWAGANWSSSGGTFLHTTGSTAAFTQAAATVVIGTNYTLTWDIVGGSVGTVTASVGGCTSAAHPFGSVAGLTLNCFATATTAVAFTPSNTTDLAIDNIKLQVVPVSFTLGLGIANSPVGEPFRFYKTMNHATKDEVAYQFNAMTNKATSGGDTLMELNDADVASPGTSLGINYRVGGVSKFSVTDAGFIQTGSLTTTGSIASMANINAETLQLGSTIENATICSRADPTATTVGALIRMQPLSVRTNTSGAQQLVAVKPSYNQTSGTAANTDLLINRTESNVGSGRQMFFSAGKGGGSYVEYQGITNIGINTMFVGANVASGATIAATGPLFHLTGVTQVDTLTAPAGCTAGCTVRFIADGVCIISAAGNFALGTTTIANTLYEAAYDAGTSKWYLK